MLYLVCTTIVDQVHCMCLMYYASRGAQPLVNVCAALPRLAPACLLVVFNLAYRPREPPAQ